MPGTGRMLSLYPSSLEFLQVGHLQSQRVIRPVPSLGPEIDGVQSDLL